MPNGNRQFDPVAAAATSALDASQRSLRQARSQANAPELPAESQAFTGARNAVQTLSQFSPANVLARGDLPSPPGGQGQGVNLPGMQGPGLDGLLQSLAPQNVLQNVPGPQDVLPNGGGQRRNRDRSGNNSGGDSGGGGSGGGSSSSSLSRRRSR